MWRHPLATTSPNVDEQRERKRRSRFAHQARTLAVLFAVISVVLIALWITNWTLMATGHGYFEMGESILFLPLVFVALALMWTVLWLRSR